MRHGGHDGWGGWGPTGREPQALHLGMSHHCSLGPTPDPQGWGKAVPSEQEGSQSDQT